MPISRVNRTITDARRVYDRLSNIYDLLAGSSETPLMRHGLEMLAVGEGEAVLEIGCGTGKALVELSQQTGNTGKLYAIELSGGMLRKTRQRLANSGMGERVSLLEGDGSRLPCQSRSFDAVFISFTLELFDTPEISHVLAECRRVLKADGRLGVVSLFMPTHPSWIVRLYEWIHGEIPAYVDCRPIEAEAMIQAAGFKVHDSRISSMWGLPVQLVIAYLS